MKKVYVVCSKEVKLTMQYSILQIVSSKKKAKEAVKIYDELCPKWYHYYFEEPVL